MEVFLHKICGQPVQPPVSMQLRRCTPEQAPAVYALQNEVRAAMPDRSSSCRTRWKTSRPMSAMTCASAHGRAAALAGISSCASAGAAHTTMRPSWMCRAPSGSTGQCGQRHRPRRLSRQRPAAAHAGSSAAAFPEKNHPYRCYRQPAEPVQPAQRPCVRFCHRLPAGNVRRPRPLPAGKRAVKSCKSSKSMLN